MRLTVAIALAALYVGLSLLFGGVKPREGIPWWIIAPVAVTVCAFVIGNRASAFFAIPWDREWRCSSPPRRIRLSWRTAIRIPALAPVFIIPYHLVSVLRLYFDIKWAISGIVAFVVFVLAMVALRRWREIKLLQNGEMAMGVVVGRSRIGEGADRIVYEFVVSGGMFVSGKGWDAYGLQKGASVPVFYNANDPRKHIAASGCWFEAE